MTKEKLDTNQPVEFTAYMPDLGGDFTVRGDYASIEPVYAGFKQVVDAKPGKKTAVVDNQQPTEPQLASGVATELKVLFYDLVNGTQFRPILNRERQLRKDAAFAQRLGLLSIEPCAKHRKTLDKARDFR